MADQLIDKLIYGIGIRVDDFINDSERVVKQVREMGDIATKTFEQDFGRRLGQAIDPKNIPQIDKARRELVALGPETARAFERSLGRQASKALFDPFLNEAQTFSGKIKASLRDSFNIKNIALGTAAGFGITALVSGLASVSTAIIKIAGDAAETRSKFDQIFGGLANDTRQFANEFADSVGRARIDIEDFLASFQTILEPLGFADKQAAEFSKSLVQLATDVASFNNKLDADVIRDFQSALVGESEPVKKYGIIVNETRVKQEALNLGIIKTGEELTETGKVFVRYQVLLKDTAAAQGDAVRTADSFNNQTKRLQGNLKNLADNIGSFFLPAIQSATIQLNNFLEAIAGIGSIEFDTSGIKSFADEVKAVFGGGLAFQQVSAGRAERVRSQQEEIARLKEVNKQLDDFFFGVETVTKGFVKQKDTVEKVHKAVSDLGSELTSFFKFEDEIKALQEFENLFKRAATREAVQAQLSDFFDFEQLADELNKFFEFEDEIKRVQKVLEEFFSFETKQSFGDVIDEFNKGFDDISDKIINFAAGLNELSIITGEEFSKIIDAVNVGLNNLRLSIIEFAEQIRKPGLNFGDFISGFNVFTSSLASLRTIGDLFGSLFGRSREERLREQLEIEKQQAIAAERAREAARKAAEALEQLERAARDFGAGELEQKLRAIDEELQNVADSTRELTDEEIRRAIALQKEVDLVQSNIKAIEDAIAGGELSPEELREAQEELQKLNDRLFELEDGLGELGLTVDSLTAAEISRLETLLLEKGILQDAIDAFKAFGDDLSGLIEKLNLTFDLKGITENAKKLRLLIEGLKEQFDFVPPADLPQFIQDGLAALTEGGQALIDFLTEAGLEELTAEEFARLLEILNDFSKEADSTNEEIRDIFRDLIDKLNLEFDLFDITDPIERLARIREAVARTFDAELPGSIEGFNRFIEQAFEALQAGGEKLQIFLRSVGLEELTAEQLEELIRLFESLSEEVGDVTEAAGDAFAELLDRLQLEFNLFDISDPIAQLKRFQQEILKRFGAIIPETQEGIDALIQEGFAALMAGGDALKVFLASINLEELTEEQFRNFLEFLEGLADEVQAKADEVIDESERIGISAVKSITFQQANVLINEVATIREVVTQILDEMRGIPSSGGGRGGTSPVPPGAEDDFLKEWFELFDERIRDKQILSEVTLLRESFDDYQKIVSNPIIDSAIDIASLLRITPGSLGRVSGSIADLEQTTDANDRRTNDLLEKLRLQIQASFANISAPINVAAFEDATGVGGAEERFRALVESRLLEVNPLKSFEFIAGEFDRLSAQNAMIFSSIQNFATTSTVSIYIVHSDGTIVQTSQGELEETDRRLAEKILTMSRGRGA